MPRKDGRPRSLPPIELAPKPKPKPKPKPAPKPA